MKDLRYLTSIVVILGSILFVGCGISDPVEHKVGKKTSTKDGESQTGADENASLDANPKNAETKQAASKKSSSENTRSVTPKDGFKLENSKLSVSIPKEWAKLPIGDPEHKLSMVSSINGKRHKPVLVSLSFSNTETMEPEQLFKIAKLGRDQRDGDFHIERMQKVAGHDALRLEWTELNEKGKRFTNIFVTIPLDGYMVSISAAGLPEHVDAARDIIEGIIDSIEFK